MSIKLVKPSVDILPSYKAALEQGWSPDNVRNVSEEQLQKIAEDSKAFLGSLDDREAKGDPIILPDGSTVARLPGYHSWMWDGEFCGDIGFRWQPGTSELPPHCLGHIGYSVVPWKRRNGYATQALALLLPEAKAMGMKYVLITANPNNPASQKVILANGGVLVRRFEKMAAYGGGEGVLFRINL